MTDRELYAALGARLRQLREAAGLTQESVAQSIHMSRTSVTNIEAGRQAVDYAMLYSIASALNVKVEDLLVEPESPVEIERGLSDLPHSDELFRFIRKQALKQ